ncbi:MAG: uncharacterized protein QG614_180 [Patescibacteria group bacterium]|nr:uncharacterized protein [Patescibacteria group bacterium]
MFKFFKENNLTAPAIIIGLAIILTALVFRSSANLFANKGDSITVTGSTERYVTSDTAKWNIMLSYRSSDLRTGNQNISKQSDEIKNYLIKNGYKAEEIRTNAAQNFPVCALGPQGYENCSLGIVAYNLNQTVTVESSDVNKVDKLSKEINNDFSSYSLASNVEYYYNNLKNVRAEMLNEATKNALERAKSVADAGGANIGKITSLSSGVFQVTAKNSVNYDDYGSYDTAALEKKITATVKANFSVK